jgi:hypothetical protein
MQSSGVLGKDLSGYPTIRPSNPLAQRYSLHARDTTCFGDYPCATGCDGCVRACFWA